ncbi:MAG TPA: hypothetical protein VIP98_09990 [Microlunatus sp.]
MSAITGTAMIKFRPGYAMVTLDGQDRSAEEMGRPAEILMQ